jgi:Type III restriction enzyme, res subunit
VLPTGSGKTRVAVAALARLERPTVCLVPTRVLLWQWVKELAEWHRGPIGCFGDGQHRIEPITVCTFESAMRHGARFGAFFRAVIVDEVHHFCAGVQDEALEMLAAGFRLGLTGTLPSVRCTCDAIGTNRENWTLLCVRWLREAHIRCSGALAALTTTSPVHRDGAAAVLFPTAEAWLSLPEWQGR